MRYAPYTVHRDFTYECNPNDWHVIRMDGTITVLSADDLIVWQISDTGQDNTAAIHEAIIATIVQQWF